MLKNKFWTVPVMILVLLFTLVSKAQAVYLTPSSFYGQVQISDGTPAVGDTISAYIRWSTGDVLAASTAVKYFSEADHTLVYAINVPGDSENNPEGKTILFKIGDRVVSTGVWHEGTNVSLNFHPPAANAGGPYAGDVNTAISFSGSVVDALSTDTATYSWDWDNNGSYDETGQAPNHTWTTPGTYTVGMKAVDVPGGEGTATATVTVKVKVSLTNLEQTYDGTAKAVTVTTDPTSAHVTVTYNGSETAPTTAGDYPVVATVTDTGWTGSAAGTLKIAKAPVTVTVSGGGTYTYNGSAHAATVSVTGAGGLSLTPDPVYSCGTSAPVNVAQSPCTASYTYPEDTNHLSGSGSAVITIKPAEATIALVTSSLNQTYDNSTKTVTATTTPVGLTYSVSYQQGGAAASPINAGSYDVTATITDTNYTGSVSGTLVIAKAAATVTLTGLSYTYDNTAKAATVNTTPTGLTVNVTYQQGGTAATPINAGDYTVTATVNDTNYAGSASDTLKIDKAGSAITVTGGAFTYDGQAHPATVLVTGAGGLNLTGNPITYSGKCSAAPVNVAETGDCTATSTYAGDTNHLDSGPTSATITITPAPVTLTLANLTQVYDGTPKAVTVNVTYAATNPPPAIPAAGIRVLYGDPGSETAPTADGSYAVTASLIDGNYSASAVSGTLLIKPSQSLTLLPGWNLVSFSLTPESTALADVLAGISGKYDLVYAWDAAGAHSGSGNWLKADTIGSTTDTLTTLDEKMGFWIHVTGSSNQVLTVVGVKPVSTSVALYDNAGGWNLVGYPSEVNRDMPGALSGTGFSLAYAFHANDSADSWKLYDGGAPAYANDLTQMAPGWGYWVKVSSDPTWTVAYK